MFGFNELLQSSRSDVVQYNLPSQQEHEELHLSSNLAGTGKFDILQSVT